jgi:hypothetical protein
MTTLQPRFAFRTPVAVTVTVAVPVPVPVTAATGGDPTPTQPVTFAVNVPVKFGCETAMPAVAAEPRPGLSRTEVGLTVRVPIAADDVGAGDGEGVGDERTESVIVMLSVAVMPPPPVTTAEQPRLRLSVPTALISRLAVPGPVLVIVADGGEPTPTQLVSDTENGWTFCGRRCARTASAV